MTKLPRKPLSSKKDARFFNDLVEAFSQFDNELEIKKFLLDLLTPSEQKTISKRFQIALMLEENLSYEEIRFGLKASNDTIAKINNWFYSGCDTLRVVAKRFLGPKKKTED